MCSHPGQPEPAAQIPSADDWGAHRQLITRLYIDEEWTLTRVRRYMQDSLNFRASTKMYKSRFRQWNVYKKRKRWEMAFAARTLQRRDREGKDTEFMIRGHRQTRHNIQVYQMRLPALEATELDEGEAGTTPPDIVYYTPPLTSPRDMPAVETDTNSETTASIEDMLMDSEESSRRLAAAQVDENELMTTPTRRKVSVSEFSPTNLNIQPALSHEDNMFGQLDSLLTVMPLEGYTADTSQMHHSVLPLRDSIAHTAGLAQYGSRYQPQAIEWTREAFIALPSNLNKDIWLVLFELCQSAGDLAASVSQDWLTRFLVNYHGVVRSNTVGRAGPWEALANFSRSMVDGYDTSTSLQVQHHIHQFLMGHRGMADRMSIVALFDYAFGLFREGDECIDDARIAFEHVVRLEQDKQGLESLLFISSLDYLFHIALRMGDEAVATQTLYTILRAARSLPEIYWRRWYLCCMLNGCALLRCQNRRTAFDNLAGQTRLKAEEWVTRQDPFIMEIGRSTTWM